MSVSIGDKVRVYAPSPLPSPFSNWGPEWQAMVKDLHLACKEIEVEGFMTLVNIDGIRFDRTKAGLYISNYATPFIPMIWVKTIGNVQVFTPIVGKPKPTIKTPTPSYFYCNSCGGSGNHRLMCPLTKKVKDASY